MQEKTHGQLSHRAAAHVRGLIMSGAMLPGQQVRPEDVGIELDISATPVREALQTLKVEGFLEQLPRIGFVVAELTGDDIRDIFRVHALVGGELACRAAEKATPEELGELQALHHELIAAASRGQIDALEERNHAFHRHINAIARSRKIVWALGLFTRYVPRQFYSTIPGWPSATTEDHADILEAIVGGDGERARLAMIAHIVHAGDLLADNFDSRADA